MARADVPDGLMALYNNHALRNDCSGFVRAAGDQQNNTLPPLPSDALIGHIEAHWTKVGQGTDARRAIAAVRDGHWVIALLKAAEHKPFKFNKATNKYDIPHPYHSGHLATVLKSAPTSEGYPYVVSGGTSLDGQSDGEKAVRAVWRAIDAPNVRYYRSPQKTTKLPAS
jgi:hypothetical protein